MQQKILLSDINHYSQEQFVEVLGGIFEHSPWVADLAYEQQPFESVARLHRAMLETVERSPEYQRMGLICNHPELAGKEASAGTLTRESTKEQAGAGLDQCSAAELTKLQDLNRSYREKFDFPFIIAVSGLNRWQIIEALEHRIGHTHEKEFDTSIEEIGKIGEIRLAALIQA